MCHFVGNFFLFHSQNEINFMIIYLFSQKYSFTAVLNLVYTPAASRQHSRIIMGE